MLCRFSATTWKVSKFGENKTTQTPDFFFLRSYVQSHVFSIVLQCFSMVTRWTIQFEIIQKLGWNQVLKKKRSGHRRGVRQGFFVGGGCSSRIFFFARPVTPGLKKKRSDAQDISWRYDTKHLLSGKLFSQLTRNSWTTSLLVHHNVYRGQRVFVKIDEKRAI